MFIFPRRTLQRQLDEVAALLSPEQSQSLVKRLNAPGQDRLAAMWELIVLWALSRLGQITHEAALSSGRRPDVTFESKEVNFIADITTVSDSGLHDDNGLRPLWADLQRLVQKYGLNGNHFSLEAAGAYVGKFGDAKVKLALPAPKDRAGVVKRHIEPFVRRAKETGQAMKEAVEADGHSFILGYNPKQRYAHISHLSYDVAASRDKNPLGNRLKAKARQLKGAPEGYLTGIIACDGGCGLMKRKHTTGTGGTYDRRQVAADFLRQNSSIDFVMVVSVDVKHSVFGGTAAYQGDADLILSDSSVASGRITDEQATALSATIKAALDALPAFTLDPLNASYRCMRDVPLDMIGGQLRSGRTLKISSRSLISLLAGNLTLEEFLERYEWTPGSRHSNPFAVARQHGQLIKSVKVEQDERHDDDWLVIEFGDPDPAVAPFSIPTAKPEPHEE